MVIRALADGPKTLSSAYSCMNASLSQRSVDVLTAFGIIVPSALHMVAEARRRVGIQKVCFETWGGLGDVLLTTPVYECGKREGFRVYVHVRGYFRRGKKNVVLHNPNIDELIHRRTTASSSLLASDSVVITPNYRRTGTLAVQDSNAVTLIGRLSGFDTTNMHPSLFFSGEEEDYGESLKRSLGRYGVVHLSSAGDRGIKDLPVVKAEAVVHGAPDVRWLQVGLRREPRTDSVDFRGRSLRVSFTAIRAASVFVGPDSIFSHVAAAVGTPGVVVFGPSSSSVWGHPSALNLQLNKPCSPCLDSGNVAPYCQENYCIADLRDETLVASVRAALNVDRSNQGWLDSSTVPRGTRETVVTDHGIRRVRSLRYSLRWACQKAIAMARHRPW